ncbi:hypothetical protein ET445_00355 [Agromyces protaetiae]|uniref:Gram-positive cocci surface proteins LPxTG domain-containing protein n=1 Tax=Agromyces protaetiae TaxID=2509455 RepID=A0A4P6FCE1_9MICO|nr:hypothetical protein [Agromyces protaetiae]QAY72009.1 hypothetical protein ET445_00355 [Agromyces protaetiae]
MLKKIATRFAAAGLVGGVALAGVVAAPANAEETGCEVYTTLADWDLSSTSEDGTGHNEIVEQEGDDLLHVWTDATGHRKAAGYYELTPAMPLANATDFALDWTGTTPAPGGQLVVDLDGDGTADGTLVIEPVYSGNIWLSVPAGGTWVSIPAAPHAPGGGGYPNQGSFAEWTAAYENAQVLAFGYSLGSGITGDGTISSISVDGCAYTFGADVPVSAAPQDQPAATGETAAVETEAAKDELAETGFEGTQGLVGLAALVAGFALVGAGVVRRRRAAAE